MNRLNFGKRSVIRQGGSYMISLPMQWMKSMNPRMKTVIVEMDSENRLRIVAENTSQNTVSCSYSQEVSINNILGR
jgi:polysaccharide deacetylase 2 family uncharacterized protein YibQ